MSDSSPTSEPDALFSGTVAPDSRMSVGAWFGVMTAKLASLSEPERPFMRTVMSPAPIVPSPLTSICSCCCPPKFVRMASAWGAAGDPSRTPDAMKCTEPARPATPSSRNWSCAASKLLTLSSLVAAEDSEASV
ncbi:hypothetical protein ACVWZV_000992 [Bradyrhizobium sp. GM5.1]